MSPPWRVLIVDDHELFGTSLARTLADEPDLDVVGAVTNATDALAAVEDRIDVVLCDFRLSKGDGLELTRDILAATPQTKVVMLTASQDEAILAAALEAGCSGFVTKTEPLDRLVDAVRAAAVGQAVVNPVLLARLLPRLSSNRVGPNPGLTPRELEVLRLVALGMSNKDVAVELSLAVNTIRNHVASILSKLGVHSKLEAVAVATKRGVIRPPID